MSRLYWKTAEGLPNEAELGVDEDHPLPSGLYWSDNEDSEKEIVNPGHPLPAAIYGQVTTGVKLYTKTETIPGIIPAAAFAIGDQFGQIVTFGGAPRKGIVRDFRFYDLDNEGINKDVWLFSGPVTLAADNAAFALNDQDSLLMIGFFGFSTWRTAANCQIGQTPNTPLFYELPSSDTIYAAVVTQGTDNIAADKNPRLQLVIEVAS